MKAHIIKQKLQTLYYGDNPQAQRFRFLLLALDIMTLLLFALSGLLDFTDFWGLVSDLGLGFLLSLDLIARLFISRRPWRALWRLSSLTDGLVILSLIAGSFLDNLAFLRVLRFLRLMRSYHMLKQLRRNFPFFRRREDIFLSSLNLFVFIFVITAVVFVLQESKNPAITSYLDALYFTVTTLTTTGFGDITLTGPMGRFLAIVIMVFGVALFLRLVQTIFKPLKIHYPCPKCGLNRHDPDAVHCKHCGHIVHIHTEGDWY